MKLAIEKLVQYAINLLMTLVFIAIVIRIIWLVA